VRKGGGATWGDITIRRPPAETEPESNPTGLSLANPESWIDDLPNSNYSILEKEFMKNYDFKKEYNYAFGKDEYKKLSTNKITPERIYHLKELVHKKTIYKPYIPPPKSITQQTRKF